MHTLLSGTTEEIAKPEQRAGELKERELVPRDPGFCPVQHGVDERAVVKRGLGAPALGDGDTEHRPLRIGQSMAVRTPSFDHAGRR